MMKKSIFILSILFTIASPMVQAAEYSAVCPTLDQLKNTIPTVKDMGEFNTHTHSHYYYFNFDFPQTKDKVNPQVLHTWGTETSLEPNTEIVAYSTEEAREVLKNKLARTTVVGPFMNTNYPIHFLECFYYDINDPYGVPFITAKEDQK